MTTITAGGSITYDLTAILGADEALYDKLSARVDVKVNDTDNASPTYDYYVNSEGVVSIGVNPAGDIIIHNFKSVDIDCYVRIDVPLTTA